MSTLPVPPVSLALLPATNPRLPYHAGVPIDAHPTDELVKRLTIWRKIIKQLIYYFKEYLIVREYTANINTQLVKLIQFPLAEGANLLFNLKPNKASKLGSKIAGKANARPGLFSSNSSQLVVTTGSGARTPDKGKMAPKGHSRNRSTGLWRETEEVFLTVESVITSSTPESPEHTSDPGTPGALPVNKNDLKIPDTYFDKRGNGGIMDLLSILSNYHRNLSVRERQTAQHLVTKTIPRLEGLRKDLSAKIREIKLLNKSDYKCTQLKTEIAVTGRVLTQFVKVVEYYSDTNDVGILQNVLPQLKNFDGEVKGCDDPYLLKLKLELQLRNQLIEELYVKENFMALQTAALELDKIVYKEVAQSLLRYSMLVQNELEAPRFSLADELNKTLLTKLPENEWEYFVRANPKHFLVPEQEAPRKLLSIVYPYKEESLVRCIRQGPLSKKNKLLKNYTTYLYVLTPLYLHEFKADDRKADPVPQLLLFLSECYIVNFDEGAMKFTIQVKPENKKGYLTQMAPNGLELPVGKSTFVFKCKEQRDLTKWFNDLNALTGFDTLGERFDYIRTKLAGKKKAGTILSTPALEEPNAFEDAVRTAQLAAEHRVLSPVEVVARSNTQPPLPVISFTSGSPEQPRRAQTAPGSPGSPEMRAVVPRTESPVLRATTPRAESPKMRPVSPRPSSRPVSPPTVVSTDSKEGLTLQERQQLYNYHAQQLRMLQQRTQQQQVVPQTLARTQNSVRPAVSNTLSSGSVTKVEMPALHARTESGLLFGSDEGATATTTGASTPAASSLFLNPHANLLGTLVFLGHQPLHISGVLSVPPSLGQHMNKSLEELGTP